MAKSKQEKNKRKQKAATKRNARGSNKKKTISRSKPLATQQGLFKKPTSFSSLAELTDYASKCIYVIARIRQENGLSTCSTLGTGFLAGRNRLITCAHVMNGEGIAAHRDGDTYLLAYRNPPEWHRGFIQLTIDDNLFIYPDNDSAVIYLPDSFYYDGTGKMLRSPDHFLDLEKSIISLGTDVGVLGYPMQSLDFTEDGSDIKLDGIILRADRGVVNTRYKNDEVWMYEFTMGFNPGNSGGPILDINTGKVIAMVHGYQSIPIKAIEEEVPLKKPNDRTSKNVRVVSVVRALYSLGLGSQNYISYENKHKLSFR